MPQSLPVYGGGGERKREDIFVNLIFKSDPFQMQNISSSGLSTQLFKSSELDQNMSE